jgi:four helix bundle protein
MFDFQKLEVYQKSKSFNKEIYTLLKKESFDRVTNDQLLRASFSIMLNISESSSRFSHKDRRHFLVISRGSAFECVSILEFLSEVQEISPDTYNYFYRILDELSRMMYSLIKKLSN